MICIGDKIKKLSVIELISGTQARDRIWLCKCECGKQVTKQEGTLKSQRFTGCNCHLFLNEVGKKYNFIYVQSYCNVKKRYSCVCDCGKVLSKRKFELYSMISCGCKKSKDYTGRKVGKLTYIKKTNNGWYCSCDCGKFTTIKEFRTESCGCLIIEKSKENIKKAIQKIIDNSDGLANIRKQFKKVYSDGNLSFNDFLKLSQENCYYCGEEPKNIKKKNSRATKDFVYNGLDRVNNNLPHNIDNVVPCCWFCNRSKSNYTIDQFLSWVKRINKKEKQQIKNIPLEDKYNCLYKHFIDNYSDGDFKFQDFINFSQMSCHYCGCAPSNIKNNIYWQGIDRIDSSIGHFIENCVPCCKICNFSKSNLSQESFYNKVSKINAYHKSL